MNDVPPKSIDLFSPSLSDEDRETVQDVLKRSWLTRGPEVEKFEKALADYLEVEEVVCVDNASNGLNLIYRALRDECPGALLTTPTTFASTATAGMLNGYPVKLFDEDPLSTDLSVALQHYDTGDLFVPMHYGGRGKSLRSLAESGVTIVEDACHAFGSLDEEGNKIGSCAYSRASVFSFHPAKNITTLEGGAITTKDTQLARRLRALRHNGIWKDRSIHPLSYNVKEPSLNAHLSEVSASLGRSQLTRIEAFKKRRFEIVSRYAEHLKGVDGLQFTVPHEGSCYHLATVLIDFEKYDISKDDLMTQLTAKGISTNVHYIPLYRFDCLDGFDQKDFPITESFYDKTLSLPIHVQLSDDDVAYVASELLAILGVKK